MLKVQIRDTKSFDTAVKAVAKFSPGNASLAILENIHVKSIENGLSLTATDLEVAVSYALNSCEITGDGEFLMNRKTLMSLAGLAKAESDANLTQTEAGVALGFTASPNFKATFFTPIAVDEFPMLPESDPEANWIEFDPEHIQSIKAVAKYAETKERYRVGYDAVQFGTHGDDWLYAYTTDGDAVAFAKLGRTLIPNFAIRHDAVKKALQIANTPDLKKSGWRVTLPTEDREVLSIQIEKTAVSVRAGDTLNLTNWLQKHIGYFGADDNLIAFDPKALTDGMKKVSKLFVKEARVENIVVIEGDADGKITMTAKALKGTYTKSKVNMPASYTHAFSDTEIESVTEAKPFRIQVDGKKFQNVVKDLAASKAEKVTVHAIYGDKADDDAPNQDAVVVSEPDAKIGFILSPKKL